jgi:hypothetical protein
MINFISAIEVSFLSASVSSEKLSAGRAIIAQYSERIA